MKTTVIEKKKKLLPLVLIFGLYFLSLFTAACNTMQGAGEDVQAAGETIEDTAEDAAN